MLFTDDFLVDLAILVHLESEVVALEVEGRPFDLSLDELGLLVLLFLVELSQLSFQLGDVLCLVLAVLLLLA